MQPPPQGPYQAPRYSQGPYQPQPGQQPYYYPMQPGSMRPQQPPPPRPPRKRKKTAIGCGVVILLFLVISSCNHLISGGRGIDNMTTTDAQDTSNSAASTPAVVATMAPEATTDPTQPPATPTHVPAPTPVPTQPPAVPTPVPTQAPAPATTGINGNPWGYTFAAGALIYNPPADFCSGQYFSCVTTFWKDTNGYVSQCANGLYTHSGGVRGECSRDGGKGQILYSH